MLHNEPIKIPMLNQIKLPANAPEEVKEIVARTALVKENPSFRLDYDLLLPEKLKIAEALQEKGYNPLDYNLDIEKMKLGIKRVNVINRYNEVEKQAKIFENYRQAVCRGDSPTDISADIRISFDKAYNECRKSTHWFKRIFTNINKKLNNPYMQTADYLGKEIAQITKQIQGNSINTTKLFNTVKHVVK